MHKNSKTLGIIPARFASSRFPGKPLADIGGMSMIERVYKQVDKSTLIDAIYVATDDDRIFKHVRQFGGQVMMTDAAHPSGTDRVAEVAKRELDYDIIINIQGDEPFISPSQIDRVIQPLMETEAVISTLGKPIKDAQVLSTPNVVKVIFNRHNQALYFSRHPIPYIRDKAPEDWLKEGLHYKHLGIYGFKRATLLELSELPPGRLEQAESLEQLRWLEAGYSIYVAETDEESIGIDTPEDLERVKKMFL